MSLCAEKLRLHYFQGLGNTFLIQRNELRHEAAFQNRQHCGLSTDSLALSFNLCRYNVPFLCIICCMLWCNVSETFFSCQSFRCALYVVCCTIYVWVKLLHHWHIIIGETYFMGEDLHEILHDSSNKEYTENKHSEGSNGEIHKGSSSLVPLKS